MFLEILKKRNPRLMRAAVELHQRGSIPANTWLIDLDTVADNAAVLQKAKVENGLETYLMSKQFNRNPLVNHVAMRGGLHATVCVDVQCARAMGRWQVPVGHVGHLNQIPRADMPDVLVLRPEVWTLYSEEQAAFLNDAARLAGRVQDILLRVYRPGDVFFEGQEGGFRFDALKETVPRLLKLSHLRIVGVTSFPCYLYSYQPGVPAKAAPNMQTIRDAADILRDAFSLEITQINAPGNASVMSFPIAKAGGATHVEPGHGLLGTTPNHRFIDTLPERPAYCYVSEITHKYEGMAYGHGGGLFIDSVIPGFTYKAAVAHDGETVLRNDLTWNRITQIIDYHIQLKEGDRCEVGDTVITADRTQMQMTRSWIAVVTGISGAHPRVVGLFDHAGHMLDEKTREVIPTERARALVLDAVQDYPGGF